ncbi:hypothetical protein [Nocardia altamirensis]|uniref:hypothetical protein n=1 Tax=Nocardia altamirensis TaxID=472158 RepID=UPI0008401E62|nr:hypothetical protein [Nocardia altamirensis]
MINTILESSPPEPTAVITERVAVDIGADLRELGMLRAITDTVCMMADVTLDVIPDIRLVLSEAATALILDAVPGSRLGCEFTYSRRRMSVQLTVTAARHGELSRDPLSWRLVEVLTDSAELVSGPFDPDTGGYQTALEFGWARAASGQM